MLREDVPPELREALNTAGSRQWDAGWFRREGASFTIELAAGQLMVSSWCNYGGMLDWTVLTPYSRGSEAFQREVRSMASKWIQAAVREAEGAVPELSAADPALFKDRPALAEFMTVTQHDNGTEREPSVLMVVISADGVRVGLKDDAAGGWLWRVEDTFQRALGAIEKALQAGNVKWSRPKENKGKRR
jgi:hypothetical protein